MGLIYFMFMPTMFWLQMAAPSELEAQPNRPQTSADVIYITERHRLLLRRKILRRQRRGG